MDNAKIIYSILKALDGYLDVPAPDFRRITPEQLGITRMRWERILIMMQEAGLITGIVTEQCLSDPEPVILVPIHPRLTMKGLEYLESNSLMSRIAKGLGQAAGAASLFK